jgi:hypothetical protein
MAMPSTPTASRSSTMRFCPAAVPSPRRNSTVTSGSSASAFSTPRRAIVQKSVVLFVMNASLCVPAPWRAQPVTATSEAQVSRTRVFEVIGVLHSRVGIRPWRA